MAARHDQDRSSLTLRRNRPRLPLLWWRTRGARGERKSVVCPGLTLVAALVSIAAAWLPPELQGWLWSCGVVVGVVALGIAADAPVHQQSESAASTGRHHSA